MHYRINSASKQIDLHVREVTLLRHLILPQINSPQLTWFFFWVSPFTREPCRYRLLAAQFTITKARAAALNLLATVTWGHHHTKGGSAIGSRARQIVRCSHIAEPTLRDPSLFLNVDIQISVSSTPVPSLPRYVRPLFTTFSCRNLPLQKPRRPRARPPPPNVVEHTIDHRRSVDSWCRFSETDRLLRRWIYR